MFSKTDRMAERIHSGTPRKRTGTLISAEDAAQLLATNPSLAEARARQILEQNPGNRTALLLLGAALREQGRAEDAKAVLKPLVDSMPHYAGAQFELGLALAELGETSESVAAFLQVIDFNPAFSGAWYELGDRLALLGSADYSTHASADEELPERIPQLEQSKLALRAGHLDVAERLLREVLNLCSNDVCAIKLLADTLYRAGRLAEAEALLAQCVALSPDFVAARFRYAMVLRDSLDFEEALRQADELLRQQPANSLFHYLRAILLVRMEAFDRSIPEYEAVLKSGATRAGVWLGYAQALKTVGRDQDCIAAFKKVIELVPSFGEAYRRLASVKTYRFEPAVIDALRSQLSVPRLLGIDRVHLHFALAKALDDSGQYADSFDNYLKSNALQRKTVEYSASATSQAVRLIKAAYSPGFVRSRDGTGSGAAGPIFIVGLPRAGSTLIEQILCSHSAIEALGELRAMGFIAAKGADLSRLEGSALQSLADEYLRLADARRKLGRPFFTDKMPANFFHIGLIRLVLPNARIIDARRHPLDCCISCFTNYFPFPQVFAYDLTELGRYYADYVELMAHFDELFPGKIHRVIYEQLIEDPESEVRRLLGYVGLPFEHACLRFYETDRGVRTMSAEQVRMPLYRHGVGRWRRFDPWLGPLKAALGSVLEAYPAVPESFP